MGVTKDQKRRGQRTNSIHAAEHSKLKKERYH